MNKRIIMWIMGRCMKYLMVRDEKWIVKNFDRFRECAWWIWDREIWGKER